MRASLLSLLVLLVVCVDLYLCGSEHRRGRGPRYGRRRKEKDRQRQASERPQDQSWSERQRESRRGGRGHHGMGRPSMRHNGMRQHRNPWEQHMRRDPNGGSRWEFQAGPFGMYFNRGQQDNWWQGPNVCMSSREKPMDEADIRSPFQYHTMACSGSHASFQCSFLQKTSRGLEQWTQLYECCDGYTRQENGCTKKETLTDIGTLLEHLELEEFTRLLDASGLLAEVTATEINNFTLFAPSNEALNNMLGLMAEYNPGISLQSDFPSVVIVSQEINETVLTDTRNILLGHLAVGHLMTAQLENNQILETASPTKSTIRINTYESPTMLVTANCVKVTNADNKAINGVVHVTEEVLIPVTSNLLELIQKNPELSTIKTVLGSSTLAATLREDGQITMFAPTDSAFKKHSKVISKLLSRDGCLDNLLKNHLLLDVVCSSVIQTKARATNSLGNIISFTRDARDKLYVEGIQIIVRDIMATNGVLYIIDDVLIPDQALGLLALAEKNGLTQFSELIELSGLKKDFENSENVTMFVPSNDALMSVDDQLLESLRTDKEALGKVLRHHLVEEVMSYRMLYNNMQLETVGGVNLRVKEYSMFPYANIWRRTIQCAQLTAEPIKGCNGVIFVIDKLLTPPAGNLLDVLAQDRRLSTLAELFKVAGLAELLQQEGPFTVFAPTNDVFEDLGRDAVNELRENPAVAKEMLLNLVTADSICCAAIMRQNWFNTQNVRTLSGAVFPAHKSRYGTTHVGQSEITQCDMSATNGVVHIVDGLVKQESNPEEWDFFSYF